MRTEKRVAVYLLKIGVDEYLPGAYQILDDESKIIYPETQPEMQLLNAAEFFSPDLPDAFPKDWHARLKDGSIFFEEWVVVVQYTQLD